MTAFSIDMALGFFGSLGLFFILKWCKHCLENVNDDEDD
jgi:hypothetical protein